MFKLINNNRRFLIIFFILAFFYFLTRVYSLSSLPIFTDEAIYTRWSQIARFDANWRFISLTDGKQPLFIWLDMVFMRFISDPLLAGRLVSVFAGFFTMTGLYFLGKELFSKKVGIIAAFLYLIYPFALVYDRMALYDSLVATGAVWSLFFEVLLIKHKRLDLALILGMILGASVLTKTPGFFFIYLLPFSLLLFDWKSKKRKDEFFKWAVLGVVAAGFAYIYYSVLRLSPFFHIIDEKNSIFVYPFSEWIKHPFNFFPNNFQAFFDWFFVYTTPPFLILIALSAMGGKLKEKALLFAWFIAPLTALALFGNTLYPRFILFMTMPLIVLGAYSLDNILNRVNKNALKVVVVVFFTGAMIISDYFVLNDFAHAPIPKADLTQYINDWPAGGGVKEAIDFFQREAKRGKIFVGTQGTFGLMPYALEIYLYQNKNVEIKGFWPLSETPPQEAILASKKMPVYFLFYQPCHICKISGEAPVSWSVKEELRIKKAGNNYLTVYRINPQ